MAMNPDINFRIPASAAQDGVHMCTVATITGLMNHASRQGCVSVCYGEVKCFSVPSSFFH